ncbi:LacI family transcriptional regulator [Altererythrobacter sp. B11]|nr:LacI family transcriptional regulator [Altererythrobacter sp. B11]
MKTVSRVLNQEAHVRPALQAKVKEAVEALGYRPNLAARQLAGQRSFIIAYPFNNPSPAYITEVLMGAARACRDKGYHLVSEPIDLGEEALEMIERLVRTLRPDGMILTPPLCDMARVVEHVERLKVPLVRIAGGLDLYGEAIQMDDRAISREMVAHLVQQGHRRIGFVLPHPDHAMAQSRYRGYLDGLGDAGIAPEESLIRPGRFDVESGAEAAHALLDLPQPPTAIFAANDYMALGAMRVAHSRGLAIPGDVAIAGFDDSSGSRLAFPALTTVRQPVRALGETAAAMLLGEKVDLSQLRHELLIRPSTAIC